MTRQRLDGLLQRQQSDDETQQAMKVVREAGKIAKWALIGITALSGVLGSGYIVKSDSQGVVQRFGKYTETTGPGFHFKIPFGVDRVTKVPTLRVLREEFGFRTLQAGVNTQYLGSENASGEDKKKLDSEGLMLTGELNLVYLESLVQYKIRDPVAYLFNIKEPIETLRDCHQSVMRGIVGDQSFDEVIGMSRIENQIACKERLQKLMDTYRTGIEVTSINLQSCNPPKEVRNAFNGVNQAMQQKDTRINEAKKKYNAEVSQASGQAQETIKGAEAYAIRRVNEAKG
ncbi:MAG: FtsH protease activity modulator HflK, partial [archaeon]